MATMPSSIDVHVDAEHAKRYIDSVLRELREKEHPLRIETEGGWPAPVDGTRVTVGGMMLRGVQSINIRAESNHVWVAVLEVEIDPAADITRKDQ